MSSLGNPSGFLSFNVKVHGFENIHELTWKGLIDPNGIADGHFPSPSAIRLLALKDPIVGISSKSIKTHPDRLIYSPSLLFQGGDKSRLTKSMNST